ncbi:MAG: hypothetical protein ABID61_05065 [Candidatus Micrarchaeota archaeon]
MASPKFKEVKAPPTQVMIPRLAPKEAQRRAEKGYDKAVATLIKERFSKPPSKDELKLLASMLKDPKYREDNIIDLDQIMKDIQEEHPEYAIARYYEVTSDFSWIASGSKIKFNAGALAKDIKQNYLINLKSNISAAAAQLSDPEIRGTDIKIQGISPDVMDPLVAHLSKYYSDKKGGLPLTLEYQEPKILFATLLPPPVQTMDFDTGG